MRRITAYLLHEARDIAERAIAERDEALERMADLESQVKEETDWRWKLEDDLSVAKEALKLLVAMSNMDDYDGPYVDYCWAQADDALARLNETVYSERSFRDASE
jgi:hypothetical protein